jgi:hypothetical protein
MISVCDSEIHEISYKYDMKIVQREREIWRSEAMYTWRDGMSCGDILLDV